MTTRRTKQCWWASVLASLLLWSPSVNSQPPAGETSCIACHSRQPEERLNHPVKGLAEDVHLKKGFSCHSCHGGNPDVGSREDDAALAHDRDRGFVGAPSPQEIPDFCARCHADVELMKQYNPKLRVDQLLEYRSSHHGKLLAEGDTTVANCISCHGVHGILPVADTRSPVYKTHVASTCAHCHANAGYMRRYSIPTDQFDLYSGSVHGMRLAAGELSAPTCNNCHGNHGATPPGLTSIANACGECHANNRDFFNQSPHKAAYADLGVGDCDVCHGHHDIAPPADSMLGVKEGSLCLTCHIEGDGGYASAGYMAFWIDSLKMTLQRAHDLLDRAGRGGVDVALGKFDLRSADDALIKSRTSIHYFDTTKLADVVQAGLGDAARVIVLGEEAMHDLQLRRVGLAVSLPLILFVALGLMWKIRQIERRNGRKP